MWLWLQVFFTSFGVIDPIGNVPVYLGLTKELTPEQRWQVGRRAVLRASAITVAFIFLGTAVLDVFQVSLESFRIAGGLVMLFIGFQIVFGLSLTPHDRAEDGGGDVSTVPLATPLIAGPGTLTLAVILAKEYGYLMTLAGMAANLAITYFAFRYADWVLKLFGRTGASAFAKMIGFILMAMGVEFIRRSLL